MKPDFHFVIKMMLIRKVGFSTSLKHLLSATLSVWDLLLKEVIIIFITSTIVWQVNSRKEHSSNNHRKLD